MGEKSGALQLEAETLAKGGAGQTVDWPRRVLDVQDEHIGQHSLNRARIDVGLIGNVPAFADPAPIPHQQMTVLVFHDPPVPLLRPATVPS